MIEMVAICPDYLDNQVHIYEMLRNARMAMAGDWVLGHRSVTQSSSKKIIDLEKIINLYNA